MIDFPLMLQVPVVNRTQWQSNKFAMGVGNEASGDSKCNDSPGLNMYCTDLILMHANIK